MRKLRRIAVLAFLLPACLQKGASILAPGGASSLPGAPSMSGPSSGSSEGTAEPSLDTPPIAGPSESDDVKPEIPINGCDEEIYGTNCPEILITSRSVLCTRENPLINPLVTASQATVVTPKPMSSTGVVDLKIWRYTGEGNAEDPGSYVLAPGADLKAKEADVDAVRPGMQLATNPDGSVVFRLVAGVKTGYYEFWILGDLDTAFGSLSIESCATESSDGDGDVSNPFDGSAKILPNP